MRPRIDLSPEKICVGVVISVFRKECREDWTRLGGESQRMEGSGGLMDSETTSMQDWPKDRSG